MMKLSTAVWALINGKPIPQELVPKVIETLRSSPNYLKPIIKAAEGDHREELSPKLQKHAEKYRRSPNQSGKINPRFIILHHTAGSHNGSLSWILKAISKVSYHYLINPKDGSRTQFVWDTKKAWHAGRSSWKGLTGLNSYSIGIAFAGDTYDRDPADYEIDSCARKCIYLMDKFDLDVEAILTHQMIAPDRKNDCAPEVHQRVLDRIKEIMK